MPVPTKKLKSPLLLIVHTDTDLSLGMDSLISELSNINTNNLRRLSLEEVPSHIGGSKPTKTVAPCQLHSELLSKVQPIPPVTNFSAPIAPTLPIPGTAQKKDEATSFSFELSELNKRHRPLTVRELDAWLSATRPPKWRSILDKIRKRSFQLEPTMYEDFIIL